MKIPLLAALRFLFPLCFTTACCGQIIISEFMADNKKTLADVDGDFSDWIEIYNTGATNVNLSGWALTDDSTVPPALKWLRGSVTQH